MKVVIDIEANALENPSLIWVIVCKDIESGELHVFRRPSTNAKEAKRFLSFAAKVDHWVGHNILGYDLPVLSRILRLSLPDDIGSCCTDTLILSKMADFSREGGHSIEQYGKEIGLEKIDYTDFTQYTQEMEDYCKRDVEISERRYSSLLWYLADPGSLRGFRTEQDFQYWVANYLHSNGFGFDLPRCERILERVEKELGELDEQILTAFPPKLKLVREITPRLTKYGTLNKNDFRWVKDGDLSVYNGGPFSLCSWVSFNPSSHKQIIEVLNKAGWRPIEKTKTHVETLRELGRTKSELDSQTVYGKLKVLKETGWKVNEENLSTLPSTSPAPARLLAKRILLESRRRSLTEWSGLVESDGRIHGRFQGIGAWTHRMSHQEPNTANIPNSHDINGKVKLLGKELRSLWCAPKGRLLVGCDAEGIQLRIFAHYIDDKEFTQALVNGRKEDGTDPHSLNKRIMGSVCKSRAAAKRFIYALLLGAGNGKLAEILETGEQGVQEVLGRIRERYAGFDYLKSNVIPADAKQGWFKGLDGRKVGIPGNEGERRHLAMSGYLQNGEAVVMKLATLKWHKVLRSLDCMLVDLVHDEWQVETPNNVEVALRVAAMMADSLRVVGEELQLKCPLAGSYYNDGVPTIGTRWSVTH